METVNFKEIFNETNRYKLVADMNSVAIPYLTYLRKNGVDSLENCKYFLLALDKIYQLGLLSPLRDPEYDEALEIYLDAGGEMIRGDMSSGDKAMHVYPDLKGTIKKVHFISEKSRKKHSKVKNHKSLETWMESVIETCKEHGLHRDVIPLGLYTKYDGLSLILEVENGKVKSAITRGDKDLGMGQNKSRIFRACRYGDEFKFAPKFGLKCEVLMSYDNFKKYNKKFGNNELVDSRSAVTAILNAENPTFEELGFLTLMPLMLNVDGVEYPIPNDQMDPFEWAHQFQHGGIIPFDTKAVASSIAKVEKWVNILTDEIKNDLPYPADGIVIRIEDPEICAILGRNEKDCINNWERAYKFPPETAKSKVINVVQEIGSLGKLSFTAKVEPVTLKHKVIKSVSLGSQARFNELKLAKGDEVLIQYDIIPYLTVDETCERSGNTPFPCVSVCPDCGHELEYTPELSCVNPECPSRVIGKIVNYCDKMNIPGIGEGVATVLYNEGLVSQISDLYEMDEDAIAHIEGFGKKSAKKLVDAIHGVKQVDAYVFLGSLGIPSAGRRMFQKILKKISLHDIINFTLEDVPKLCNIEGIKHKTARKIVEGIMANRKEIDRIGHFIEIIVRDKEYDMIVCFTKVRNKRFEDFLLKQNIKSVDVLTKDVNLLITGDSHSSKIDKALKWGIPILTINEAYSHFGYVE